MEYLFLHGLGQTAQSWEKTLLSLRNFGSISKPELFSFLKESNGSYQELYASFVSYCSGMHGPIHLCGLSLGAVLALHYALDHPQKVASLVLIAPQYKMPKTLLKAQNLFFRFMPEKAFRDMGITKKQFLTLTNSMLDMDFSERLRISCPVLILCGEKDRANQKAAKMLAQQMPGSEL